MNLWQRTLYWGVTGALFGFGLIGMLTIGLPFLLLGAIMLAYGAIRIGWTGVWGMLVGFGLLPALFLLPTYFFVERCAPGTVLSLPADAPPGTIVSCGGVPPAYLYLGIGFVTIATFGLIWGIVAARRRNTSAA